VPIPALQALNYSYIAKTLRDKLSLGGPANNGFTIERRRRIDGTYSKMQTADESEIREFIDE
jgi:hypothetical protein